MDWKLNMCVLFVVGSAIKKNKSFEFYLYMLDFIFLGKRYGDRFLLKHHLKQHAKITVKRPRRSAEEKAMETSHCSDCNRNFSNPKNLQRHQNVVHLKIKRFVCEWDTCNSKFGSNAELKVHYRQHTGEKVI
jgi:uncharacterized Zn-finger protein